MDRVLEEEVMDTAEEALAYDAMDHSAVNTVFVDDLLVSDPDLSRVLDVGTGTGLIVVELCKRASDALVTGVDLSEHMLELARANAEAAGVMEQVRFDLVDAKGLPYDTGLFTCVMSNSIVHHIPDPLPALAESVRVTAPGGNLFVRDLMRPSSVDAVQRLVELYAGDETDHAKQLFDDSLRAALELSEIRDIVVSLGFAADSVQATSDRHWTWCGRKPG